MPEEPDTRSGTCSLSATRHCPASRARWQSAFFLQPKPPLLCSRSRLFLSNRSNSSPRPVRVPGRPQARPGRVEPDPRGEAPHAPPGQGAESRDPSRFDARESREPSRSTRKAPRGPRVGRVAGGRRPAPRAPRPRAKSTTRDPRSLSRTEVQLLQ